MILIFYNGHKVYMNVGYPAVFVNGKNEHIHRLEWIKHNGEIPKGYVVHHKDENKLNWNIENLELLSRSQHIRKHKYVVHRSGIKVTAIKNEIVLHFNSIETAAATCGTHPCSIQRVFKGEQRTANGWCFERG